MEEGRDGEHPEGVLGLPFSRLLEISEKEPAGAEASGRAAGTGS